MAAGMESPDELTRIVAESIQRTPDVNAIQFGKERHDWGEIAAFSVQLAAMLPGLDPGAVIGLLPRNRPATLSAFLAIVANGWTVSIINPYQSAERIAADIKVLALPAVIADPSDWSGEAAAAAIGAGSVALSARAGGALALEMVPGSPGRAPQPHACAPDVAVYMITSGTTGPPKRVPLLRRTLRLGIEEVRQMSLTMGETASAEMPPLIQHVSLAHLAGITMAMQMAAEHRALVLLEKFTVADWLVAVTEVRPEMAALTPTMMRMILAENVTPEALSSLIGVRSGTAPLDDATQREWERRYGIPVLGNYGATEYCGPIASWSLADHAVHAQAKRGSVGRLHAKAAVVRVLDRETGAELTGGESGLLQVQVHRVGEDWITTNDIGRVDADGFVFLEGRADDAINRGGFKVVPDAVADILRTHPAVLDVAVIGIPDERLGHVPVAFAEPAGTAAAPDEGDMMTFARQNLLAYQMPVRIVIVDALPRTPSGKVARPALHELIKAGILGRITKA